MVPKRRRDGLGRARSRSQYEANENTFAMPANPAGEEFETAWQDDVNRVLNGVSRSPEEAMARPRRKRRPRSTRRGLPWTRSER